MPKTMDLAGRVFGRLTVVKRVPPPLQPNNNGAYWECRCTCGGTKVVRAANLHLGHTTSCGCVLRGRPRLAKPQGAA
jgi:hypothetical protein